MYKIIVNNFNLDYTLSCGQVFRWDKEQDWWRSILNGSIVRIKQEGNELLIDSELGEEFFYRYFRLDDDLEYIYSRINRDEFIDKLITKYRGLRLIRQEPWECLVSYICSSNNTIRNIRNSIRKMSACLGEKIENDKNDMYSFPTPEALSTGGFERLAECKLGFRSRYVAELADMIRDGRFDFDLVRKLDYHEARKELRKIKGVGPKIADCVLLFAFDRLEAFPVDTHIKRIMTRQYGDHLSGKGAINERISAFARNYFGNFCGYAQEYLYIEASNQIK